MKETQFIQQNKEKWSQFEDILSDSHRDPDKIHDLYIQITDDLSHARTFYPARSVRVYLNGLAQGIFGDIHKQKKSPLNRIKTFFTDELPQVIHESRWSFFSATFFFFLSFAIGYISSMMDEEFLKVILGDEYVNMTVENIKKGDPMAVYKSSGRFDMTFGIMANNIRVTLMYFILGIFAGVGSVAMLMYNGVMVGAFLQFFSRYNLLKEANLTIWMHGSLEISAIIIGAAAGITMGRGLLFPGTYTRLQAFQMSARKGIRIMVGVIGMLVIAALIEGNLTRHTELGTSRVFFIAASFASIIFYYAWLPFYKARQGFKQPLAEAKLPPDNRQDISYDKIKSVGEIFGDTFFFFNQNLGAYLSMCGWAALYFCAIAFFTSTETINQTFELEGNFFNQGSIIVQFFHNTRIYMMPFINSTIYTSLTFIIFRKLLRGEGINLENRTERVKLYMQLLIIFSLWSSLLSYISSAWIFVTLISFSPFLICLAFCMMRFNFNYNYWKAFLFASRLLRTDRSSTFNVNIILFIFSWFAFSLVNCSLFYFYFWMIGWNFSFIEAAHLDKGVVIALTFMASYSIFILFSLFVTAFSFLFYSLLEITYAETLLERIKEVGTLRKIRGMIRE